MIIKAAKRIFNSDKICRSYSDLNFGVTFLENSVYFFRYIRPVRTDNLLQQPTLRQISYSSKCLQQAASKAAVVYDMHVCLCKVRSKLKSSHRARHQNLKKNN